MNPQSTMPNHQSVLNPKSAIHKVQPAPLTGPWRAFADFVGAGVRRIRIVR
jgi:hypothetical protein